MAMLYLYNSQAHIIIIKIIIIIIIIIMFPQNEKNEGRRVGIVENISSACRRPARDSYILLLEAYSQTLA